MEAHRFDDLIKSITATRLTRVSALRGVAAGAVAALAGMSRAGDDAEARKNKNKKKNSGKNSKQNVCQCTGNTVASCAKKKVKKSKLDKFFKDFPCSYRGKCLDFNPCSSPPPPPPPPPSPPTGFPIAADIDIELFNTPCIVLGLECPGTTVCYPLIGITGVCVPTCVPFVGPCDPGTDCVGIPGVDLGVCLPSEVANERTCVTGADCDTGRCDDGFCVLCPVMNMCGAEDQEQCCVDGATCQGNTCVL